MKKLLAASLLLLAFRCASPAGAPPEAAAPAPPLAPPGSRPPYVRGVLPLDPSQMVYQQNNVSGPPTALFYPVGPDATANFNPGPGLLLAEHTLVIDLPPQWEARNLTLHLLDGQDQFSPGQRYYAVARGTGGREDLVYTFTGDQYNEEVSVPLPRDVVYERLVLRGPVAAQPARLRISGEYRPEAPARPARRRAPLAAFTGANAFPWNFSEPDGSALSEAKTAALHGNFGGGMLRLYIELDKFVPVAGQYQFQYWNLDELARRTRAAGSELLLTFVHATRPERDTWPAGTYQGQPTPDQDAPPRAFAADPNQEATYRPSGEAGYQLAARYGFNTRIPAANLRCYAVPAYPNAPVARPRQGLGYVRYYETQNELDKDWKGLSHYLSGWQMGLHQSVVYDGAQGRLGPMCGIKTADSSAVVLNAGLAKATPDAFRGMIDCWKKTRGYKPDGTLDIPVDQWNYHQYANDAGSTQNGGAQTRGVAPENGGLGATARRMADFAATYGGNRPVVLTETGYDVQPRSPLAAIRAADLRAYPRRELIPAARILRTQAVWSLRTLLEVAANGLSGIAWYQAYDDNGALPYVYQSCGLLNADNSRRPAADFLAQARALMGNYTFRERLSTNPRVDVWEAPTARGKPGARLAVAWLPVEDDSQRPYALPLPTAGRAYSPTAGAAAMAVRPLVARNGSTELLLSETPVFVPLANH